MTLPPPPATRPIPPSFPPPPHPQTLLDFYANQTYEQLPEYDQPQWVISWAGREQTRYHWRSIGDNDES